LISGVFMPDINIFKLDFKHMAKLMDKGRVDLVYNKMYNVADKRSRGEIKIYIYELRAKVHTIKSNADLLTKILDFRKERFEHHMNEMKELLEMSSKEKTPK